MSDTNMTWDEVLRRDDLVGGDFEIEDHGTFVRGRIARVSYVPDMIIVVFEWSAERELGGHWKVVDLASVECFSGDMWPFVIVRKDYIEFRPDRARLNNADLYENCIRRIYPKGTNMLLPPELVEGLPKLLDRTQWDYPVVSMTNEEWFALVGSGEMFSDNEEDSYPALPVCCGDVSAMRDAIRAIYLQDGSVTPGDRERLIQA